MPPLMEAWLRQAKERLRLHLFSNNPSRRRIGSVAQRLDLPFTTSAGKPRRSALRRVLADLDLPPRRWPLPVIASSPMSWWAIASVCSPCW